MAPNDPTRWWTALTPRGRWAAAVGVLLVIGGLLARYPVLTGVGVCLSALVIGEAVAVLRPYAVSLRRTVEPGVVVRHEPCTGTLHLAGRRRRGLARLGAADLVDGTLVPVRLPDTPGASEAQADYAIPTPRRGLIEVGPLVVRRSGLAGLATWSEAVGQVEHVRVLPRRIPLDGVGRGVRRAVLGGSEGIEVGGTDLVGLHEYTPGDDLRRLHWATSARTGRLMVRDDAEPAEPHVLVLLDDRAGSYPQDDAEELFEEAVELTAALCRATLAGGHPLQFRVVSGRFEIDVPGSIGSLPRAESREIDLLLAEIGTVTASAAALSAADDVHGLRGADVVAVVSGSRASEQELASLTGMAPRRTLLRLDANPLVTSGQTGDVLVLRGGSSSGLAAQWDAAVSS